MSDKYKLDVDKDGFTIRDAESLLALAYRRPPFESTRFQTAAEMLDNTDNSGMHERLKALVRRANRPQGE